MEIKIGQVWISEGEGWERPGTKYTVTNIRDLVEMRCGAAFFYERFIGTSWHGTRNDNKHLRLDETSMVKEILEKYGD
jgi:hypothetical protein